MSTLQEIESAVATLTPAEREALEAWLKSLRELEEQQELDELERITGFIPLPKRPGGPVTTELVLQLCREEGI